VAAPAADTRQGAGDTAAPTASARSAEDTAAPMASAQVEGGSAAALVSAQIAMEQGASVETAYTLAAMACKWADFVAQLDRSRQPPAACALLKPEPLRPAQVS
jgi:hypothetical protein